ncbi:MAG TPA: HAD-IA family hydrolase [Candidatus Polarisedimenticolaceae bacterium]|nr:HAD-IA family hydrolase [Candidatus Polarisedimenticolaceae bacterium]
MRQVRYPIVLFDAGDTLIGPRESFGAVYARVLKTLGVDLPVKDLERGLRTGWAEFNRNHEPGKDRYSTYPGGEAEYWLYFIERTLQHTPGGPFPANLPRNALEPLRNAFRDPHAWLVFPDVAPALDELRSMGVRMGVVSNWDSRLPGLLEDLGLARYFDAVAVSGLEGIEKPNPEIFLRAVGRLGGTPATTLHVGDIPELDEAGARAAGLASILIDRRGQLGRPGTISELTELPRETSSSPRS